MPLKYGQLLDRDGQSCKHAGSKAGRQCTREGVGTGSLGLVTTLALLLIWSDRVDRQVDRWDRVEVTRLSVQTVALQAAAVEGKVEHCVQELLLSGMASVSVSVHHCEHQICVTHPASGFSLSRVIKTPTVYQKNHQRS